jgi:hypothetical protein
VAAIFRYLRGKRVTYWCSTGDQHNEFFPDTGPVQAD